MKVLITGGSSGIGEAITKAASALSADIKITFTYNRSEQKAKEICNNLPDVKAIKCDFSNAEEVKNLCELISSEKFDVLIHNAIADFKALHFHKTSENDFISSFNNNINPVLLMTRDFISMSRKRKSGKIICILSSAIYGVPPIGSSLYVAEKNYLRSMCRSWAAENAAFNITCNSVSPGFVATDFHRDQDERVREEIISKHPLKKLLTAEEVAATVCMLINASAQLNGQDVILNSSQTMF